MIDVGGEPLPGIYVFGALGLLLGFYVLVLVAEALAWLPQGPGW